jgi:hypothetical protein
MNAVSPNVQFQLQASVNNSNLIKLIDYEGGDAVKGIYRFEGGSSQESVCLKDLSGNGNHLLKAGNPVWNNTRNGTGFANGVSVSKANGFLTPFTEELEYTYLVIARPNATIDGIGTIVGNIATGTENRGTVLSFDTASTLLARHLGRYKSSTGQMSAGYVNAKTLPLADRSKFVAFGASVAAANNSITTYYYNNTTGLIETNVFVINSSFGSAFTGVTDAVSGRKLAQLNNTPIPIGIGYSAFGGDYPADPTVLEVIVYNPTLPNALAVASAQLTASVAYWKSHGEVF